MSETMKVCGLHDEIVPLLWTFKFDGAEYWCPYCGYISGMFGAGKNTTRTTELKKSLEKWEEKAFPYLSGEIDDWVYEGGGDE